MTLALGTHIAETVHSLDYPHFESETTYDLVEKNLRTSFMTSISGRRFIRFRKSLEFCCS